MDIYRLTTILAAENKNHSPIIIKQLKIGSNTNKMTCNFHYIFVSYGNNLYYNVVRACVRTCVITANVYEFGYSIVSLK
jgi:hypothetical protein